MKLQDILFHAKGSLFNLGNIHSVTDFQRNPKGILGKLKATHNPIILTVNGKAGYVVQDAESYQKLLDRVQRAEDLEAVRAGAWPEGFFESTYGSFKDEPLERLPQRAFEKRDDIE